MTLWLNAKELAAAALPGLPSSERAVQLLAKRQGWNDSPEQARKRAGRRGGGGLEYHISLLPPAAIAELERRAAKDRAIKAFNASVPAEVSRRSVLPENRDLSARRRSVLEARLVVLREIDRRQVFDEMSQRQAVIALVDDLRKDSAVEPGLRLLDPALLSAAAVAVEGNKLPSVRTIQLWLSARETGGNAALAPKAKKTTEPLPHWFAGFLKFYARPQKPTIAHALDQYIKTLGDALDTPSYRQVRTALGKLDAIDRHRGREGALTLKARMAYTVRSTADLLPTSIYTADGKTFDAEIQHPIHGGPFKPEITSIIDVATRRCVGFSVGLSENAFETLDALRNACETHGIPALFYVDRGPGYKNDKLDNALTGFMGRLGITKMHSLPRNSQARGVIERFNGTCWNPLAQDYPTFLGKEMDRDAANRVHKKTRRDLKLFGVSRVLPDWETFLQDAHQRVEDYNNRPHSHLPKTRDPETGRPRHMSPNEYWAHHCETGFEPIPIDNDEADDLFRPYVKRRTRRAQIEWLTNTYFAIELEAFHGEDVLVGYDIHDASRVWVRSIDRDEDGEEAPGALIAIAEFAGNETRYVPLTAERDAIERRAKARRRRLDAKIEAVEAELAPSRLIEQSTQPVLQVFDEATPIVAVVANERPAEDRSRRAAFRDDAELASFAITNPGLLSETQRSVLKDCLSSHTDREFLRLKGIDLDLLKRVIRDAA